MRVKDGGCSKEREGVHGVGWKKPRGQEAGLFTCWQKLSAKYYQPINHSIMISDDAHLERGANDVELSTTNIPPAF